MPSMEALSWRSDQLFLSAAIVLLVLALIKIEERALAGENCLNVTPASAKIEDAFESTLYPWL
jgi:hypothetical protein